MRRNEKHGFSTNGTIRKDPDYKGKYCLRKKSEPYCYICCKHGCDSFEEPFKLKGKKSFNKSNIYHRGPKWSYKNKLAD